MTGRETSVKRPTYALTCGFVCGNPPIAPLPEDGAMPNHTNVIHGTVGATYASDPGAATTARGLADREGST